MISGIHLLATMAIVLAGATVRSTELYTGRYQTLPILDWIESRPPLADSANVPTAIDLARGVSRALPLLIIRDDARTQMPVFGPPSSVQRVVGGVRDAARITLGSPGEYAGGRLPVTARMDVIVFNRELRAADWASLFGHAMDIRDPETGLSQVRVAGPDEQDAVWLAAPGQARRGVASVVGHRAGIGFVLQVTFASDPTADAAEIADLSARAELLARQAATDWTAWAASQAAA